MQLGPRPPGDVNGQPQGPATTGTVRPNTVATLPPDDQPEDGKPELSPEFKRQLVNFQSNEPAGTIVIDTGRTFLYLVLGNGQAMRYGIGVGRNGYALAGSAYIGRKAEWPTWTPTDNMIRRDPGKNLKYAGGVPGGPNNPLGARAIYLYQGGNDTMFRIHGTTQPWSIGQAMSSGCVRMLNHDVVDLYERAIVGGRVVVLQA
jgi:lipoprotein-anchoring transpeptidase ErfK/SrfK